MVVCLTQISKGMNFPDMFKHSKERGYVFILAQM